MTSGLPRNVRDLLSACPAAGSGVNLWLFRCALELHKHRSEPEIYDLLAAASAGCGRHVPVKEIQRAVTNSRSYALNLDKRQPGSAKSPNWPRPDVGEIEKVVRHGLRLVDLWEQSPVCFGDNGVRTEEIVDVLFPGNPLLCVGKSAYEFDTRHRAEWRGSLAAMPLIVPSPMSATVGITRENKVSKHALDNTGPRRFLVVECDFSQFGRDGNTSTIFASLIEKLKPAGIDTLDMGAAVLAHLAHRAPLAMAVHSGGKSLHGWFYCSGRNEDELQKFMTGAVLIGADRATWTVSQFVRMPDGRRENGNRQAVYYFNPGVVK